uniref:Otoraplin n=1 Tax=Pelusios castaneus TaxID=367368 RepID=A0A8C8SL06_9SAUR
MTLTIDLVILLLCFGVPYPAVTGIFMDKLSSKKLCADDTISLARAEDDYNAPDCRFINIKKGQEVGEFWAGSVYGELYEDQMRTVGYFPSSLVSEQHVYQEANKTIPPTFPGIIYTHRDLSLFIESSCNEHMLPFPYVVGA